MFLQIIFTVCRNGDECVQLLLFFDIHLTAYIPNSTNNILQDCHSLFCDSVFISFIYRWPGTFGKTLAAHFFLYVDFVFRCAVTAAGPNSSTPAGSGGSGVGGGGVKNLCKDC